MERRWSVFAWLVIVLAMWGGFFWVVTTGRVSSCQTMNGDGCCR
jgi:hypothetical protein